VAVEPSSRERTRLRSNLARGAHTNVRVAAVALDDHTGDVALHLADPHHAGQNTLGAFVYDGVGHAGDEVVPATTLDALVEELGLTHVDVLKIDVEGAEVRLLDGASMVLGQHRPILLLEWQGPSLERQGSSIVELGGRLAAAGYVVLPFDERTGRPTAGRAPTGDDANVVACHRDQLGDLVARGLALPGAAVTNVEHAS
jgi:FkbM family methyltransferase